MHVCRRLPRPLVGSHLRSTPIAATGAIVATKLTGCGQDENACSSYEPTYLRSGTHLPIYRSLPASLPRLFLARPCEDPCCEEVP